MKKVGIIILFIGLLITVFTGFNIVTREKVVDIGKLEISADRNHGVSWSPIIGVVVMAIGAGFYPLGLKRKLI